MSDHLRRAMSLAVLVVALASCSSDAEPAANTASSVASTSVAPSSAVTATSSAPTTNSTSSTTATTEASATALDCIAGLPLEVRLGQLLFPVIVQADLPQATELAGAGRIGGVVLVGTPDATIVDDLATLQAAASLGPVITAVDEEGGRVQRVAALAGPMPSARALAADGSTEAAREAHRAHAEKLRDLGFTVNLAPVLDLDVGEYIRNRSFSDDPAVVVDYGGAVARGIIDGGLTPVFKHFPGHGRGVDSHTGLPRLPELDVLRTSDLLPFVELISEVDVPVMIGHLVIPGTTGDAPASLSPEVITGLLRGELGFDGVVMTDALNMDAIAAERDGATAAVAAIGAGADLAMVGQLTDVDPTIVALTGALGARELDAQAVDRSVERVLRLRGIDPCTT